MRSFALRLWHALFTDNSVIAAIHGYSMSDVRPIRTHHLKAVATYYRVKCRSRCLAIDNNELLSGSVRIGPEIINWIVTNAISNYYHSKNDMYHFTSSSFQHVLKVSFRSTNASGRRWHHLPTAHSDCMTQAAHSLLMYHFNLSI